MRNNAFSLKGLHKIKKDQSPLQWLSKYVSLRSTKLIKVRLSSLSKNIKMLDEKSCENHQLKKLIEHELVVRQDKKQWMAKDDNHA